VIHRRWLYFLTVLFSSANLHAQVELGGLIDFEVMSGGRDSRFHVNEIASDYRKPHVAISEFNFFLFSELNENFSFDARLKWDIWGTGKTGTLKIPLAMLSWEPENSRVSLSLGRFISPFGLYPRRQLSMDNLFAAAPLAYGYFINISDKRGFWPKAGNTGTYGSDDVGLTTVYYGGYSTGLLSGLTIIPDRLRLDIAVSNTAPASQEHYTNRMSGGVAARIGFQPFIFWQQGISAGFGRFIQKTDMNSLLGNREQYTQSLIGTDIILAYSYFELSGEAIYSYWKVPGFADGNIILNADSSATIFHLENYGAYAALKYEPSFLTGAYVAVGFDVLGFIKLKSTGYPASVAGKAWDDDVQRYSIAIGYKISREVNFKLAWMDQKTKNIKPDPQDYNIRGMVIVTF